MTLTPDDVIHKEFQHVRFKDGIDPEEVDDFLDEIVIEWRKTIEENIQLRARIAELEAAAAAAPVASAQQIAPIAAPQIDGSSDASTGIIAVAQRVHDEFIAEGQAKGRQLVAEAEARAAQILTDAETSHREQLMRLSTERQALEGKIGELREFENAYRTQLRSYFEGQLRQLDSTQAPSSSASLGV